MFSYNKMTTKDKIDFIEYLSFQLKTKSSFEKAVTRYISSNVQRKECVHEACLAVIEDIKNGNSPANALFMAGFLEESEHSLIANSGNSEAMHSALKLLVDLKKTARKSSDILKRSINVGLGVLVAMLSLIPLMNDGIVDLYQMFADMSSMASGEKEGLQLPLFVKHWWMMYVILMGMGAIYVISRKTLVWVYQNHGDMYYRVFKYKIYIDLITVLEILRQMSATMSMNNAYRILSKTAPTQYWRNLFSEVDLNLKNGGKANEVFAANGTIPIDVVYALSDAEETGENESYLAKAISFCTEKNDSFQDGVRVAVPMFFELLIFFIIGLIVIKFVSDMNNLGIMNVILQLSN